MVQFLLSFFGVGLFCMALVLLHQRRHLRSSLTWPLLALFLPVVGFGLYLLLSPYGLTEPQKIKVQKAAERFRSAGYTVLERRSPLMEGLVLCYEGEEFQILMDDADKFHFKLVTPWPYTSRYLIGGAVVVLLFNLFSDGLIILPGLLLVGIVTYFAEKVYQYPRKRKTEQLFAEMKRVFNTGAGQGT